MSDYQPAGDNELNNFSNIVYNYQVYPHTKLCLIVPWSVERVDLRPLVENALQNPIFTTLSCNGIPACEPQLLQCQIIRMPGQVEIIELVSQGDNGQVRY